MRDPGVVADVEAGCGEPAGQLIQVIDAHSIIQLFFRTGAPSHGHFEAVRHLAVAIHGPVFSRTAGEWMDDGEIAGRLWWALDPGHGATGTSHLLQEEIGGVDSFI